MSRLGKAVRFFDLIIRSYCVICGSVGEVDIITFGAGWGKYSVPDARLFSSGALITLVATSFLCPQRQAWTHEEACYG